MTDVDPVLVAAFGAAEDTDWYYPAHPWHAVVELPRPMFRRQKSQYHGCQEQHLTRPHTK